jgi:hypothetical protein
MASATAAQSLRDRSAGRDARWRLVVTPGGEASLEASREEGAGPGCMDTSLGLSMRIGIHNYVNIIT